MFYKSRSATFGTPVYILYRNTPYYTYAPAPRSFGWLLDGKYIHHQGSTSTTRTPEALGEVLCAARGVSTAAAAVRFRCSHSHGLVDGPFGILQATDVLHSNNKQRRRQHIHVYPFGLQSYLLRRWDWGGCQEGPVIPSEEVLGSVGLRHLLTEF